VANGGSLSFLGLSLSIYWFSIDNSPLSFAKDDCFDYNALVGSNDINNAFRYQIET
jgi:hypothetical protein